MKNNASFFKILSTDRKTKARIGEITTAHGKILTPAFVPVGSQGTVKSLSPQDLEEIGSQVLFANTYHLYLKPGATMIEKLGGLNKFMGWPKPLMTDSGGFQVFSLGKGKLAKIDYNGVTFYSHLDGSKHRFTPEKSIEIQQKLRADIMVAFDECAPYPTTHEYAEVAMERTHRWAFRSLEASQTKKASKDKQFLFGVIQGSVFKDLRQQSAQFISSQNFDGLAIGGVAVGESKKEMASVLDWVMPVLAGSKRVQPIHLLGLGEIDDIFTAVEEGIDMMDCVMPTRLARMGWILTKDSKLRNKDFRYDITKAEFAENKEAPDPGCHCYLCRNFSKAYLHHLFRSHELLAYRLATYHNLFFIEQLFAKIREAIKKREFLELKKQWLED
jgi:queuine tRNA-ribosyltransferase